MPELYPYQTKGALFLARRNKAYLADEMGLGKTCQAISACDISWRKHVLVLCPASVKGVWSREFKRFSPLRKVTELTNGKGTVSKNGVVVCSYSLAATSKMKAKLLKHTWNAVICDEAHFLKGHLTKRTRLVFSSGLDCLSAKSECLWLLSGTPMPNNPSDIFPVAKFFGIAVSRETFIYRYCLSELVPTGRRGFVRRITGTNEANAGELKLKLSPFLMRRLVKDIAPELPKITHNFIPIDRAACDVTLLDELSFIEAKIKDEMIEKHAKGVRLSNVDSGHIARIRRITGTVKAFPSSSWILNGMEGGMFDKIVVYAYHTDAIAVLTEQFINRLVCVYLIKGGMTAKTKADEVNGFINHKGPCVLIANILVGGVGIDGLQYATSDVIFLETTWSPSDYVQAVRRVCRHGQTKPVRSWVLTVPGTVDDRVQQLTLRKSRDISLFFDSSEDENVNCN